MVIFIQFFYPKFYSKEMQVICHSLAEGYYRGGCPDHQTTNPVVSEQPTVPPKAELPHRLYYRTGMEQYQDLRVWYHCDI